MTSAIGIQNRSSRLALGLSLVLFAAASARAQAPEFVTGWDVESALARDVAVTDDGDVWVLEGGPNLAVKRDAYGTHLLTVQVTDPTGNYPESLSVDSSGNIYVADQHTDRVLKFDAAGNYLLEWGVEGSEPGQLDLPLDIDVGPDGSVFVADAFNHRVQAFDGDGNFLFGFGSYGIGDGEFKWVTGIVVDSQGNIYVADDGQDRIQKFDSTGNFLLSWGKKGSGDGEFNRPQRLGVDSDDNVYVVDRAGKRVQKFDSDGNYLLQFGSAGSENGQFEAPVGIDVSSTGWVYTADTQNNDFQVFGAAPFGLAAHDATVQIGDELRLRTFGGPAGQPAFLSMSQPGAGAAFTTLLAGSTLDDYGHWEFAMTIDTPALAGSSWVLRTFSIDQGQRIVTNEQVVTFE